MDTWTPTPETLAALKRAADSADRAMNLIAQAYAAAAIRLSEEITRNLTPRIDRPREIE